MLENKTERPLGPPFIERGGMGELKLNWLIVAAVLAFLIVSCAQNEYHVKNVIDGDTIELDDGSMIRYIGIDTPETRSKQKDGTWLYQPEDYSEKAKEFNRRLVCGKKVRLEYDMVRRDKYNRALAYVFVKDTFVNAELLKQGYALLYSVPPNVKYIDYFIKLQKEARENKRGLWNEANERIVSPGDVQNYPGRVVYVEGRILDIYKGKNITILNFGKGKKDFKAVIFKNNLTIFENRDINIDYYLMKRVKIHGKVEIYKGAPEIILDVPEQIEIIRDLN